MMKDDTAEISCSGTLRYVRSALECTCREVAVACFQLPSRLFLEG
jgi:hypothetical protein